MIRNRKIKVALVGCGRIAATHFNAIKHHDTDLELVAVCDVDHLRLEKAASEQHVPGYSSLEKMLQEELADVVILATPSGLHSEQTCLVASYGKHVITEKPMATQWKDGVRMVEVCDAAGVYLFVIKQNRQNATIQALKKAIDAGRFGRIYLVTSNVFWTRPQSYYEQDYWRGTWEFDGGAFMNQASHYVDLLDWLIGPVESIQSMMGTLARNIEVEDTGVLNIKWRSGTLGSMSVTMLTYRQNLEGSITILGENGTVRLGGPALNQIEHWEFKDKVELPEEINQLNYQISSVYGTGHILYYENVINVFRGKAKPQTDGHEGLRSLELLVSAYMAQHEGKTIHLPVEQ